MNKSRAIWKKCLVCGGDSPKEVTLCAVADCSLWPYRFGYTIKDKRYRKRMIKAESNYPKEYRYFIQVLSGFLKNASNSSETTQIDEVLKSNLDVIRKTLDNK